MASFIKEKSTIFTGHNSFIHFSNPVGMVRVGDVVGVLVAVSSTVSVPEPSECNIDTLYVHDQRVIKAAEARMRVAKFLLGVKYFIINP
jgi:hypothetical protein